MSKASDIKNNFGHVTEAAPIYLNSLSGKNRLIKSLKSDNLKYPKSLCEKCNTARSGPYDRAWERFIGWASTHKPPLEIEDIVWTRRIFPNDPATSMLHVYLYLLKAFGCMAHVAFDGAEWGLDLRDIGKSFLDGTSHPRIFVRFGVCPSTKGAICATDPWVFPNRIYKRLDAVWWIYAVNGFGAAVFYVHDNPAFVRKERLWHPSFGTKRLAMADLR